MAKIVRPLKTQTIVGVSHAGACPARTRCTDHVTNAQLSTMISPILNAPTPCSISNMTTSNATRKCVLVAVGNASGRTAVKIRDETRKTVERAIRAGMF